MNSSPATQGLRVFAAAAIGIATAIWTVPSASAASAMATGGATTQPIGHYEFCKTRPAECSVRPKDLAPARLTSALWGKLTRVTAAVNAAVKPLSDQEIYGKDEVWAYPDKGYVLEKRRRLARQGVSLANLLVTVVRKPDGEGHAVLTVRTDKGDFVLDNLTDKVKPWDQSGYRFLKRQAIDNTGRWVSIREGQQVLVGAVQ